MVQVNDAIIADIAEIKKDMKEHIADSHEVILDVAVLKHSHKIVTRILWGAGSIFAKVMMAFAISAIWKSIVGGS